METIIEKIHEEFKRSADSSLKKSKKFLKSYKPIEIKESSDVDFLKSIGFNNVDFVRQQDEFNKNAVEKNFQDTLKLENDKALAERILELKKLYPNYSVVTEDTIKSICNKYGLVFASSKYYTGSIPNKNIAELQEFTKNVVIDDDNKIYYRFITKHSIYEKSNEEFLKKYLSIYITKERYDDSPRDFYYDAVVPIYEKDDDNYELVDFFIAAPPKDFNFEKINIYSSFINGIVYAKNSEILSAAKGVKTIQMIEDPVIVKPIMGYEHKSAESSKYKINTEIKPLFLLATLWGIEKYDPALNNKNPINYN